MGHSLLPARCHVTAEMFVKAGLQCIEPKDNVAMSFIARINFHRGKAGMHTLVNNTERQSMINCQNERLKVQYRGLII